MRHDLKTPLNAIITAPQMIKSEIPLQPEQSDYLDMIEDAGYRMLEMINLSLDMFKMERGSYAFRPAPVDIVAILQKIKRETSAMADEKKITTRLLMDGEPAGEKIGFTVIGEELLCYSMLANLLKNAIEASPANETVTIALKHEEDLGEIHIHNRGAVPEAIRERFFEKYVTQGKSSGTGLGTYSASLITRTQGGDIRLRSSEPEGTTITVSLPADFTRDKAKGTDKGLKDTSSGGLEKLKAMTLPSLRVLLADDDEFALRIMKKRHISKHVWPQNPS